MACVTGDQSLVRRSFEFSVVFDTNCLLVSKAHTAGGKEGMCFFVLHPVFFFLKKNLYRHISSIDESCNRLTVSGAG